MQLTISFCHGAQARTGFCRASAWELLLKCSTDVCVPLSLTALSPNMYLDVDVRAVLTLIVLIGIPVAYAITRRAEWSTRGLPPGPPSGYLGNGRFDMPPEPYRRFSELAAIYGAHMRCRLYGLLTSPS